MSDIRPPYCDLRIGQLVTVVGEWSSEWPGEYRVTGIRWCYKSHDINVSIASDDEISLGHGDTDGWGLDDLLPIPHPTDNASAAPSEEVKL